MSTKNKKIKVHSPRTNPHICYIPSECRDKIEALKRKTGLTLYRLICTCANHPLSTIEEIKNFKEQVIKDGFKDIGDWATCLIEILYEQLDSLECIDLTSIKLNKKGNE